MASLNRHLIIATVSGVLALGGQAWAAKPQGKVGGKVAVLDVQLTNLKPELVPLLTEVLTSEVDESGHFDNVISGRDVAAMLGFEAQKQMVGCTDAACLAEIGGALGVDRILAGHVGNLSGTFVVTLKLINIVDANTERRIYRKVKGDESVLLDTMSKLLREMLPRQGGSTDDGHGHATASAGGGGGGSVVGPVVMFVLGAGGIAAGVALGLKAQGHADNASDETFIGAQNEIAAGQTAQIVANVGYGVGAAAVVSGVLWLLLGGDDGDDHAMVAPMVDSNVAGIAGRF